MHGVERKGDVAEEFADLDRTDIGRLPRCPEPYQDGENEEDADGLEYTIQADWRLPFDIRYAEKNEEDGGAYPKCPSYFHGFEVAGQKHSHGKGEEHPNHSAKEIGSVECPADANHSVTGNIKKGEPR